MIPGNLNKTHDNPTGRRSEAGRPSAAVKRIIVFVVLAWSAALAHAQVPSQILINHWPGSDAAPELYPWALLRGTGPDDYRVFANGRSLALAQGRSGSQPASLRAEERMPSGDLALMDAQGNSYVLSSRSGRCQLASHDAQLRPRYVVALQLTTNQDAGCYAMAVAPDGTAYVRDSGDGLLVVDANGEQLADVALQLPPGAGLDARGFALLGDRFILAWSRFEPGVGFHHWIGAYALDGNLLWQQPRPDDVDEVALALESQGIVLVEELASLPISVRVSRFAADGTALPTGFAAAALDSTYLSIEGVQADSTRIAVRAYLGQVDVVLVWRAGFAQALQLTAPADESINDFALAEQGRVYAVSNSHLLRFAANGAGELDVPPPAGVMPRRLLRLNEQQWLVATTQTDLHASVLQLDGNYTLLRSDPITGPARTQVETAAHTAGRTYFSTYTPEAPAQAMLRALDERGRSLWTKPGNFRHLRAGSYGVWAFDNSSATRYQPDGNVSVTLDLQNAYAQPVTVQSFPDLADGLYALGSAGPQLCRLVHLTAAGLSVLRDIPANCLNVDAKVTADGAFNQISAGVLSRLDAHGVPLWSIPALASEYIHSVLPTNGLLLIGSNGLRRISSDGAPLWSAALFPGANSFVVGSNHVYQIASGAPARVQRLRLSDGVIEGETALPLELGANAYLDDAVVANDGSLASSWRQLAQFSGEICSAISVNSSLEPQALQRWTRGCGGRNTVWSHENAVYTLITTKLDGDVARPAVIRAGGELLLSGFE